MNNENLIQQYSDMLNGNCCCICLDVFFEIDKRTPKTFKLPHICDLCLAEFDIQFRRAWFNVPPISYKNQKSIFNKGEIPYKTKIIYKSKGICVYSNKPIYIPERFLFDIKQNLTTKRIG